MKKLLFLLILGLNTLIYSAEALLKPEYPSGYPVVSLKNKSNYGIHVIAKPDTQSFFLPTTIFPLPHKGGKVKIEKDRTEEFYSEDRTTPVDLYIIEDKYGSSRPAPELDNQIYVATQHLIKKEEEEEIDEPVKIHLADKRVHFYRFDPTKTVFVKWTAQGLQPQKGKKGKTTKKYLLNWNVTQEDIDTAQILEPEVNN